MSDSSPPAPMTDECLRGCHFIAMNLILNILRLEHADKCFMDALPSLFVKNEVPPNSLGTLKFDLDKLIGENRFLFGLSSFMYVTWVGYLVYATTVFDTFLSDLTKLLLTRTPAILGENCKVSIGVLVSPEARGTVINKEINKKIRNLSYASFEERLDYIRRNFNLTLSIDQNLSDCLRHYSELRNTAVHDQAMFAITFDDAQRIRFEMKHDQVEPTAVTGEDVEQAVNTYLSIGTLVYHAVVRDVFKTEPLLLSNLVNFKVAERGGWPSRT